MISGLSSGQNNSQMCSSKRNCTSAALFYFSQAIVAGQTLYMSGQIGMTPETGELVQGGVEAEAKQVLTLVHFEIGIYTCLVSFFVCSYTLRQHIRLYIVPCVF